MDRPGGGSGFAPSGAAFASGVRAGDGLVTIAYTLDSTAPSTTSALDPADPNGQNGLVHEHGRGDGVGH
jgi:hypothetical protein